MSYKESIDIELNARRVLFDACTTAYTEYITPKEERELIRILTKIVTGMEREEDDIK